MSGHAATVKSSCQNAQPRSQHLESRRYGWIWVRNLLKLQNVHFVELFFRMDSFPEPSLWTKRPVFGR